MIPLNKKITVPLHNDDPTSLDTRLPRAVVPSPSPAPAQPSFDSYDFDDLDGHHINSSNGVDNSNGHNDVSNDNDTIVNHHDSTTSNTSYTTTDIPRLIDDDDDDDSLLSTLSSRLTPHTLLGAGGSDREIMGQFYATQIANAILTRNPEESRSLVLGLGVRRVEMEREVVRGVVGLVERTLLA